MAVVVVHEAEFGIVNFRGPLEGVRGNGGSRGRSRGDGAERRVVVGRRHVPVEIHQLADVLRQIDGREIEVVAEDVDRERARRGRFFGIPEDDAFERERFRSRGVRSFRLPVCHFSLCNSDSMEIQHKQGIHTIKMHPSVIPAMRRCTLNLRPLST